MTTSIYELITHVLINLAYVADLCYYSDYVFTAENCTNYLVKEPIYNKRYSSRPWYCLDIYENLEELRPFKINI
jgi:hypothetical protein